MNSIALFLICLVLFLVLTGVGYIQIKKTMEKELGKVSDRLKRLEKDYESVTEEKTNLEGETLRLKAEVERLRKQDYEKARLVRMLKPGLQRMTTLSAMQEFKFVTEDDVERAREWMLESGTDKPLEQVLVERGAATTKQFEDARRLSELFNSILE